MKALTIVRGRCVPLPIPNINTDAIIPARFLTMVTRDTERLGTGLFYDWRFSANGEQIASFPLNQERYRGATILIGGENFGCGSSREKAPWALLAHGFQAVVAPSFADIFRNNALKNQLLAVQVEVATHRVLIDLVEQDPAAEVVIDVATRTLRWGNEQQASFALDPFAQSCLLRGVDELGYLLDQEPQIAAFERSLDEAGSS